MIFDFSYVLENRQENIKQETSGSITVKNEKYKLMYLGVEQIYDGEKTYTIVPENEEITITTAEEGEDFGINPTKLLNFYKEGYDYQWDIKQTIFGRPIQFVKLLPSDENNEIKYLRPDAKSQVTIEYSDDNKPQKITAIVVSTQHDEFDADDTKMLARIKTDIVDILIPRVKKGLSTKLQSLFNDDIAYHINPTGKFVIGGPHGDTGLTGRKIIVDTYGGKGAHGGGAFSGKDPSKVDRLSLIHI